MRLDARKFGIAIGITAGALFALCALAVAVAPGSATAFFGYLVHMDLSSLPRTLTIGSFIGGTIAWAIGTALAFGFVAALYNRLLAATLLTAGSAERVATQPA